MQSKSAATQAEKKTRQLEKALDDFENKLTELQNELRESQDQCRTLNAELAKTRLQIDEENTSVELSKKENKKLAGRSLMCFTQLLHNCICSLLQLYDALKHSNQIYSMHLN
jgi:septal ring factor EnvC (AmiA/AmiB activator)